MMRTGIWQGLLYLGAWVGSTVEHNALGAIVGGAMAAGLLFALRDLRTQRRRRSTAQRGEVSAEGRC